MNPDAVLDEDQKKIRFRKLLLKRQRLRANGHHDEANFQDDEEVSDDNDDNDVEDQMDHDGGNLVQEEDDQQNIEAKIVENQLQKQDLPPLLAVNCQTSVASFPQFVPMSSRCQKQNKEYSQDFTLHQTHTILNQKQSQILSQDHTLHQTHTSLNQKQSQNLSQDLKQSHAQYQTKKQADKLTYNLSLHQKHSQTHHHYQSHILEQKQYHSPYHYQSQAQSNRLHHIQTQKQNYIHRQHEKLVLPQLIEKEENLQNDYKKQGQSQTQNWDQKQNHSLHQNHDQNYDNLSIHQSHCQKYDDQSPPQLIEKEDVNINSEIFLQNQKQNQNDVLEEEDNFLLKIKSIVRSYQMAVAQTKCPKSDELFVKLNAIQRGVAGISVSKKEVLFLITKMSDVFRHFALLQR